MESNTAITNIKAGIDVPTTDSAIKAKISVGKAIKISIMRLRPSSVQPPSAAAKNPKTEPIINEIIVVTNAITMVLRAP